MDDDERVVSQRGRELLYNPRLNKGSAFTRKERRDFGLIGLLPPDVSTLEEQKARVMENYRSEPTDLDKYIFLRLLQDRNETLFHAILMDHLEQMAPIVYTPTVAEAVRRFSHIFRSSRGLYITPHSVKYVDDMLQEAADDEIGVIVCTDNEGILGIGDHGVGGIGIPIGKLALYVAAGGFDPSECLPVTLDVGTDNEELLEDPLYLGLNRRRLGGEQYRNFIDQFVEGILRNCPHAVLQWEDFSRDRAFDNLERYRSRLPSFNDDIQGTAVVTYASLLGALRLAGRELTDEEIVIIGAGAAGVGVAQGLIAAKIQAGLSPEDASAMVHVFDSSGLVVADRPDLPEYKRRVATDPEVAEDWNVENLQLDTVIQALKPGTVIGLSGRRGTIDEPMVRTVSQQWDRPIVFALSNPSENSDAHPHDLVRWSEGRAIIATGSPFEPLEYQGRTHSFTQVNNVYAFPGIGAGAHICGARQITDAMMVAAGEAVHKAVGDDDLEDGRMLPAVAHLREVSLGVACGVIRAAQDEGLARIHLPVDIREHVAQWQFEPRYRRYIPAD